MTTHLPSSNIDMTIEIENKRFWLLIVEIFLGVIGGLMLMFSATFVRDLQTLRNVPDALWNFLCGTPTDSNIILPLLLTIAIVCFGVIGALEIWRWRLKGMA